ncbi:Ger(x)C family spore germination protein [Shimazuella alba]|uniref:Ger(X)C family spore germination protein n=1 Tax=Shimazuella alba TaxID=2690964 RepID=A0A6I4W6P4_9BACL|nr:Ger(x)C family spore germination protein [Shimazuella alba]MXQ55982.1 Ger(x)C family spore germination protein [Shimazuella alba]
MKNKQIILLFLCLFIFLISGCWDSNELQKLCIVAGMAIDKGNDNTKNRFRITVQIANPPQVAGDSQGGKMQASRVTNFTETGSTISETLRKISNKAPGELLFPHLQVMVIGEDLAKEGIADIFDVIERDSQFRVLFPILISKGPHSAKDILEVTTTLEAIPSAKIVEALRTSERYWGAYKATRVDEVIKGLKEGSFPISGIQMKGDLKAGNSIKNVEKISPNTIIQLKGTAIFKDRKLKKWLDLNTARGVTWVMDEMKSTVINLDCGMKKDAIAANVNRSKTTTDVKIKNNKPVIYLTVHAEGEILENNCSLDLGKSINLDQLDEKLEEEIKIELLQAIKTAQKEKSDLFRFGEKINTTDKKLWKKIETAWENDIFPKTEIHVNVQAIIRRTGMITKSYR